jgi:beta-lactamase class A
MQNKRLIQDINRPRSQQVRRRVSRANLPNMVEVTQFKNASSNKSKTRFRFLIPILAIIILFSFARYIYLERESKIPTEKIITNVTPPKEVLAVIDTSFAQSKIDEIIASNPNLQISVAYKDLETKSNFTKGIQEPYLAASTAKVLTAVLFLSEVEKGTYTLSDTVGGKPASSQLELMIEESDNDAWTAFNDMLTRSKLEKYGTKIGMTSYRSEGHLSTSTDIVLLFEKLYNQELLNKEHTKIILSHMEKANETQYIKAVVPSNMKAYHKAGYLKDRAHDSAILSTGSRSFVLVIFTKANFGEYDFDSGAKAMQDIASTVIQAYQ